MTVAATGSARIMLAFPPPALPMLTEPFLAATGLPAEPAALAQLRGHAANLIRQAR